MENMIAYCGLSCAKCDAFPLNQQKMTAAEKIQIAEKWTKLYGHGRTVKAEDVHCDGCLSEDGQLWAHCARCEIRKCGREKQLKNCGYCADYPCKKLDEIFTISPEAKNTLDEIGKSKKV